MVLSRVPSRSNITNFFIINLEWVADGEVEGVVASPVGMNDRPGFFTEGRVMGFHAEVEPEQEIIEIKTNAGTISGGYLFIKRIKLENSSGLAGIIADCPDIPGIDE